MLYLILANTYSAIREDIVLFNTYFNHALAFF